MRLSVIHLSIVDTTVRQYVIPGIENIKKSTSKVTIQAVSTYCTLVQRQTHFLVTECRYPRICLQSKLNVRDVLLSKLCYLIIFTKLTGLSGLSIGCKDSVY